MNTTDEIMKLAMQHRHAKTPQELIVAHAALNNSVNELVEQAKWAHHTPKLLTEADAAADLAGTPRPSAEPVLYIHPEAPAPHPDCAAVDAFAQAMKEKLAAARAKGRDGWQTCPPETLSRMLREHVNKGDPRDVANFAMFLWSLGHGIGAAQDAETQAVLIEGVEYIVPMPVAVEMLRLHLKAKQDATQQDFEDREAFERAFPVCGGVYWDGETYKVEDSYMSSYRADRYLGQWEAWQACAAIAAIAAQKDKP